MNEFLFNNFQLRISWIGSTESPTLMMKTQRIPALMIMLLTFPVTHLLSQEIENVHPEIREDKIFIYYDLSGILPDQTVLIKVYMSRDGGETYGDPLKSVSGDVDLVTGPGKEKCIIWDVFNDLTELMSFNVKFKVKADLLGSVSDQRGSGSAGLPPARTFLISQNTHLGYKTEIGYPFLGLSAKGSIYLGQMGLGLRADYYRTFGQDINYTVGPVVFQDTGVFWGYSAGAVIEYDFIKSKAYSLYPFLYIGQSKFIYTYDQEYKEEKYFEYSIFGSIGLGFDMQVYKFFSLGLEAEYMLSPWVDLVPSEDPDEALDGISLGISLKFLIDTD